MFTKGYDGRNSILWSSHRIGVAQTCLRQYYYQYLCRPRPERHQTADMLVGKLLHERIEKFYDLKPGSKSYGKPKKKTAEEFADATVGMWFYWIRLNKQGKNGPMVRWKNDSEAYRIWAPVIKDLSLKIWEEYSQLSPPLYAEFRTPIVSVDDVHFFGILDEIRHPLTIRDHKSRKFQVSDYDLKHNVQFTLYASILSFLCHKDKEFAIKAGATPKQIESVQNDPLALLPHIALEHHFLETGYVKDRERVVTVIPAPSRKKHQFDEVLDTVENLSTKIEAGEFKANRGYHCEKCFFKEQCDKDSDNSIETRLPYNLDLFKQPLDSVKTRKNTRGQLKLTFSPVPIEQNKLDS